MRPGRVLIGGVALSVLLLAGAAIAGFLVGRPNSQWLEAGSFVTSKDTGEQYVVLEGGDDPVIRRVPNYISAQLLLGESDLAPFQVRDKYIREVTLGEDLGIDDAPAGLPDPDGLIQDGWTACTAPGTGIQVASIAQPAVNELTGSAFLVSSGGALSLIATGRRPGPTARPTASSCPRDPTEAGTLADRLGFGAIEQAPEVGDDWLNLFPRGDALAEEAFGVTKRGSPPTTPGVETDLSGYRIGDLLTTPNGSATCWPTTARRSWATSPPRLRRRRGAGAQTLDGRPERRPSRPRSIPRSGPTAADRRPAPEMCGVLHPDAEGAHARRARRQPDRRRVRPRDSPRAATTSRSQPAAAPTCSPGADDAATDGTPYVIDSAGYKYELIGPEVPTTSATAARRPGRAERLAGVLRGQGRPVGQPGPPGARGRTAADSSAGES